MARKRSTAPVADEHDAIVDWYRERLSRPVPAVLTQWRAVEVGPTWQRKPDGSPILPELSLGWEVLAWCGTWLQLSRGQPWRFTDEQARFLLWWYALDEAGRFTHRDGVLQRLKGWGKDPVGACLCATEMLGPCRFAEWDGDRPVSTDHPDAWIQTAAVSLEQTKNTMRLFPGLFTDEAKAFYGLQVSKEFVYGLGNRRMIQAVTSSPSTLEGARATFVLMNETHHWLANNEGHEMAAVIERNATKSADGGARTLAITNAYEPGEDSVAERTRDAFELVAGGGAVDTGLLYDSLEAPPEAPLSAEAAPSVVESIRGDSVWLDTDRIVQSILDTRNPASRSRRFWYNQITAAEDAWTTQQEWDACIGEDVAVGEGDEIAAFFDGSKSDDATGLVGCRMSDGHVFQIGCWQRPAHVKQWIVPREEVDSAVEKMFARYTVMAFFADPGSGDDDETGERFWDPIIDGWGEKYGAKLLIEASGGVRRHSIMWDMRTPTNQHLFTEATGRALADIAERNLTHDGSRRLRTHVVNARRRPGKYGVAIGKEHRESPRKIDLAVCMIGARMARRMVMGSKEWQKRQRRATGRGRVVVMR